MSIKLMSAIFDAEFYDIPLPEKEGEKQRMAKASTVKLVLLALADHANDYGEGAYPGLTRLERKTALSRQGLVDTISALKHNGLATVAPEPSRLGTNNYSINISAFSSMQKEIEERSIAGELVKPLDQGESSHLTSTSQATLPELVKPLDLKHTLTITESSNNQSENFGKKKGDLLDGMIHYAKVAEEKVGKRIAMQERAERELLRIRYNLKGAHQTEIDRLCDFLLREEKEGRTIEKFVEWVFADGFWVSKISSAQKVMELFYRQEELRPAKSTIPDYVPEEKHAVPNPFQKPAILRRPNSTDSTEGE